MKAAIFKGPRDIEVGERPDPHLQSPTDAVVRVVRGCVCGSDLWYYRGINKHQVGSIGHEFIGVVERIGSAGIGSADSDSANSGSADSSDQAANLAVGDLVIAPFTYSDGSCANCRAGFQSNCVHGGAFGNGVIDGGQGERVRVPHAASTLVVVPGRDFTQQQLASFTALTDVMCTGYHAAISARVEPGSTVAVIGDR